MQQPQMPTCPWYVQDADDGDGEAADAAAAKRLNGTAYHLEMRQADRKSHMLRLMSIYHNTDLTRHSPWSDDLGRQKPVSVLNATKMIVDGLVAKQVANESKATFDVSDGDWEAAQKAEELDKFQFGEVYRLCLNKLYELAFRDAGIVGDGWVKFYARDDKVFAERVFPLEITLDLAACVSGPPRELYQIRYLARSQAMALYNDHADKIAELPETQPPYAAVGTTKDIVRLVEAWHLPDHDDGTGGRYMFTCNDICLSARDYKLLEFPFVRFTWTQDVLGGYGQGVVQDLIPLQSELDKLTRRWLQGLYLHGLPKVMQAAGGTLKPEAISTDPMQRYVYAGGKPEVIQSQCFAPELKAGIQSIFDDMMLLSGYNAVQAGAETMSRVDSRPGLREYVAMADEKHAMPSKSWDRGILTGGRRIIDVAREITARGVEYATMGRARDFTRKIKFKECDLENDRFEIKLQNTSLLPTTPAGKILRIMDLAQAGAFANDPKILWRLLSGAPDVDQVIGDTTAGERLIRKQINCIIRHKKYFAPDKHQDCLAAQTQANNAIQKLLLQSNGDMTPDLQKIYDLLDQYCMACTTILTAAAAAAAPPPGAMNAGSAPAGPTGAAPSPGGAPVAA